jgi:alpha-ribazole phosphatase
MKLVLIRHPVPEIAPGTCYGRLDVPAHPRALAALVSGCLALPRPQAVFTSPLARCRAVASALTSHGWPEPRSDQRLAELDFGEWEGRPWSEIGSAALAAWRANVVDRAPPGGETVGALAERALAWAHDTLSDPALAADATVAIFTHAGVIQTLPRMLCDEPLDGFAATRIDYSTLTELHIAAPRGTVTAARRIAVVARNQPLGEAH